MFSIHWRFNVELMERWSWWSFRPLVLFLYFYGFSMNFRRLLRILFHCFNNFWYLQRLFVKLWSFLHKKRCIIKTFGVSTHKLKSSTDVPTHHVVFHMYKCKKREKPSLETWRTVFVLWDCWVEKTVICLIANRKVA